MSPTIETLKPSNEPPLPIIVSAPLLVTTACAMQVVQFLAGAATDDTQSFGLALCFGLLAYTLGAVCAAVALTGFEDPDP